MIAAALDLLACPACLEPLVQEQEGELLRCTGCARRFVLRGGMPDLVWGKAPANEGPGDSPQMVRHRVELDNQVVVHSRATRRYLDAIISRLSPGGAIVDVGTGPGTIPRLLADAASGDPTILGFDKSWAALDAARTALSGVAQVSLLRASSRRRFPLRSGAFAMVLRRLAPALPQEILRVLAPGGTLLNFTYGPGHWHEVYDVLTTLPRPRQAELPPAAIEDELYRQGYAQATVHSYQELEDVPVAAVAATLQSNPAAYFFQVDRDLPLLEQLSIHQGSAGVLRVTADYQIRIAVTPR